MRPRFNYLAQFLVLLGSLSTNVFAQKPPFRVVDPSTVNLSSDSLAVMDAYFHQLVDEGQLAGIQTAVLRHGKLVHFDSYGYANIEENKRLDHRSIFRIFSMTKPIVSVALMQLYEEGRFKLEDPVYHFLPAFEGMSIYTDSGLVPAQQPIRVVDLLRHSSGFSYGRSGIPELDQMYADAALFAAEDNADYVRRLSELPLQFEPGTDWQYGVSTNVCGHLIEVLSGQSLKDYLEEHIFEPLDMRDTHFQIPPEKVDRFTVGYGWEDENGLVISEGQRDNRYTQTVTLFNGGGGLVSTTMDYMKFCQMVLDGGKANGERILKKKTIALMLQDHMQEALQHHERLRLPYGEASFGLGFAIRGESPDHLDKVYGWGGAVGTYFKVNLEHDLAYVLMIQLSPYRQLGLRQLFQDFVEAAVVKG